MKINEQARIRAVYRTWHKGTFLGKYAWHRPEILLQESTRARIVSALLVESVGSDLANLKIVDVGCGSGRFLRQLITWGASPRNLMGTEYQNDRLATARETTANGVLWHLGDLDNFSDCHIDLAVANCVFSSIIDEQLRIELATEMWRTLKPGAWSMVFDLRYDNPSNPNIRKVTRAQLDNFWPDASVRKYKTLLLAPPIARHLAGKSRLICDCLAALLPPLRSHFIYMVQKPVELGKTSLKQGHDVG